MILGAILAGGASQRFGADKALARFGGVALIDHADAQLRAFAAEVIVVGGNRAGYSAIPDRPTPGLGPLGGVCGAMAHARAHGFASVLTLPCDTPQLPAAALARLVATGSPCFLAALPVAGLWRAADADALAAYLAEGARAVRAWAHHSGGTPVETDDSWRNINRPEDLARAERDRNASPPLSGGAIAR